MATVRGGAVLPHVQAWADACEAETGVTSYGTYPGHDPSIDRALDIFVPVSPTTLGDAVAEHFIVQADLYGGRYVIWRQRINSLDGRGWRWMADRGDPTQNHYDHVHAAFEATAPWRPNEEDDMTPEQAAQLRYVKDAVDELKEAVGWMGPESSDRWQTGRRAWADITKRVDERVAKLQAGGGSVDVDALAEAVAAKIAKRLES